MLLGLTLLLILVLLNVVEIYMARHTDRFLFLFRPQEWRLMKIVEKHSDEFDKILFCKNDCLCVAHRRYKAIFMVIWVKSNKPLSFSLHKRNTECLIPTFENKRSKRIAEKVFVNIFKKYLIGEDYLINKDEMDRIEAGE